jgi:cystathionine gamma-synthase
LVAGPAEVVQPIRAAAGVLGGVIDAHAAYLLLRGIKTLGIRMERHNQNGLHVARWLEAHPKVQKVWYPGLESHPDYAVATQLMKGFAGVVTFTLESDLEGTIRFTDRCRIPYLAPSLGGVESLIEMPALMSYWDYSKEDREIFGITDNLVRLACGIEDTADVIADLEQALEAV